MSLTHLQIVMFGFWKAFTCAAGSNQIRVVACNIPQLTQPSFYKKIKHCKMFFWYLYYTEMAQSLSSMQKSEFLKLIISFFQYFWFQNWDQWHKMSGINTHIYFFYFLFKNKRVWAEKIGKKQKKSKTLKVAGNYPNI